MAVCAGDCKKEVTGRDIIYLRRPVTDADGHKVKDERGRVMTTRMPFEKDCASKAVTPDIEKIDGYVIRLGNTWRRAFELDQEEESIADLVTFDAENNRRGGHLFTVWVMKIRGDVHRALSSGRWLAAELEHRITRLLIRQIFRLYPLAYTPRQLAVKYQLEDVVDRWGKVRKCRDEIEAARTARVEMPTTPRQEFQWTTPGMYRLARNIVDELGNAFRGKLKDELPALSREVLRAIKGSAFEMEQIESEVGDAGEEPESEPTASTQAETVTEEAETAAPAVVGSDLQAETKVPRKKAPGSRRPKSEPSEEKPKKASARTKKQPPKSQQIAEALKEEEELDPEIVSRLEEAAANGGPRVTRRRRKKKEEKAN